MNFSKCIWYIWVMTDTWKGPLEKLSYSCVENLRGMMKEYISKLKRRTRNSENFQILLFNRENGLRSNVSNRRNHQEFYKCITPNLSIVAVEAPAIFLRKFTPDGRYLLAFSQDQYSLLVYEFMGTAKAASLVFPHMFDVCYGTPSFQESPTNELNRMQRNIFNILFKKRRTIYIGHFSTQLCRECSIFTSDGDHVIIGGSRQIIEDRPSFYVTFRTNDTLANLLPEDIKIFLVNFKTGIVTDYLTLDMDKINLSNNHGMHLHKNSFAVLSILHQTIYTYEILNGRFNRIHVIGQFCNEDDRQLYNNTYPARLYQPFKEITFNSIKQRLLTFLFKRAAGQQTFQDRAFAIRSLYNWFDLFQNMKMFKLQFIDEDTLLIKYSTEDMITHKLVDPTLQPTFLMFYSISKSQILTMYEHKSNNLLDIYEQYCDYFRNLSKPSFNLFGVYPCSTGNSLHVKLAVQK